MAFHDKDHVVTMEGVVIWNGLTKPDDVQNQPDAKNWNLRIAFAPGCPEQAELETLVQQALAASPEFKGTMPHGGNHPISAIDPAKFPELPGHLAFSAGTRLGAPPVYDMNGAELQPMQYGPMFYNGTKVRLIVHAYAYSNKQKGVNFGLDGIQIVDAKAPRLSIGDAGLGKDQVAKAFGGAPAAKPQATASYTGYAQPGASDAPPPPADDAPPAPPAEWPPQGWKENPNGPGWWYHVDTKEQLKEAALRQRLGL